MRFSSIGDIVLTSPIIRCLKAQVKDVEIHFLTKQSFGLIVTNEFQFADIINNFSFAKWENKITADELIVRNAFGFEIFKNNVLKIFSK